MKRSHELIREIETLQERFVRMREAMFRINESLDLETVLRGVLDSACSLTNARYGGIVLHDERGPQDFLAHGVPTEVLDEFCNVPQTQAYFEHFRNLTGPVRTADFSLYAERAGIPIFRFPPPISANTPFLGASIQRGGEITGTFLLAEKGKGLTFTSDDEETLVMFASRRPWSSPTLAATARSKRPGQVCRP